MAELYEAGWQEFRGPEDQATHRTNALSVPERNVIDQDSTQCRKTPRVNGKRLHWSCSPAQRKPTPTGHHSYVYSVTATEKDHIA